MGIYPEEAQGMDSETLWGTHHIRKAWPKCSSLYFRRLLQQETLSRLNSLCTWILLTVFLMGFKLKLKVFRTLRTSCQNDAQSKYSRAAAIGSSFLRCSIFVSFILSPSLLVMSVVIVRWLGFHSLFLEHVYPSHNISSVLNHWHMMHVGVQVVSCLCWFVLRFTCLFILL